MLAWLESFVEPLSYGEEMMVRFSLIFVCWGIVLFVFFKVMDYLGMGDNKKKKKEKKQKDTTSVIHLSPSKKEPSTTEQKAKPK